MLYINQFQFRPGPYRHYKGSTYVVLELVTHMDGPDGKMQELQDPLVCYRDLDLVYRHVNGHLQMVQQVYARPLSEFIQEVSPGVNRFVEL